MLVMFPRTLYCAKGNYDFGISRVIRSLEPYSKKLGTDTWFYAKRCFLSLLENLAKQVFVIRDVVLYDCLHFFSQCESMFKDYMCHIIYLICLNVTKNFVYICKKKVVYKLKVSQHWKQLTRGQSCYTEGNTLETSLQFLLMFDMTFVWRKPVTSCHFIYLIYFLKLFQCYLIDKITGI